MTRRLRGGRWVASIVGTVFVLMCGVFSLGFNIGLLLQGLTLSFFAALSLTMSPFTIICCIFFLRWLLQLRREARG